MQGASGSNASIVPDLPNFSALHCDAALMVLIDAAGGQLSRNERRCCASYSRREKRVGPVAQRHPLLVGNPGHTSCSKPILA